MNKQETAEHRLTVELTAEEWQGLKDMADGYNCSRSQLIEQFIKDLIGDRENGSDEHRLACEWYDRSYWNY